jgi:hypothetical protein
VDLSAAKAKVNFIGNLVCDGGHRQSDQVLVMVRNGASMHGVAGRHNWLSGDFGRVHAAGFDAATNLFQRADFPLFVNPAKHDYHLAPRASVAAAIRLSADAIQLPEVPGATKVEAGLPLAWQYRHPAAKETRPTEKGLTIGAYARSKNSHDRPAREDSD